MRTAKRFLLLIVMSFLLSQCGGVNFNLIPPVRPLEEMTVSGTGDSKILLIDISGILVDAPVESPFSLRQSIGLVDRVKEELVKAEGDPQIRAVILRIDSPGGTVTTSDILYHEIMEYKKKTKVAVVAAMMDIAASGGYYVASAADCIVAHPTTITGSIGVIALRLNLEGLMGKVGVETETFKSGEKKDIGSPFRKLTDEERAIFQGIIDDFYGKFVTVVREGRKGQEISKDLLDGRILTASQALEGHLVDQIGYLDDAVAAARKMAGLDSPRVVVYRRPGQYVSNFYSSSETVPEKADFLPLRLAFLKDQLHPQFMYLWFP